MVACGTETNNQPVEGLYITVEFTKVENGKTINLIRARNTLFRYKFFTDGTFKAAFIKHTERKNPTILKYQGTYSLNGSSLTFNVSGKEVFIENMDWEYNGKFINGSNTTYNMTLEKEPL